MTCFVKKREFTNWDEKTVVQRSMSYNFHLSLELQVRHAAHTHARLLNSTGSEIPKVASLYINWFVFIILFCFKQMIFFFLLTEHSGAWVVLKLLFHTGRFGKCQQKCCTSVVHSAKVQYQCGLREFSSALVLCKLNSKDVQLPTKTEEGTKMHSSGSAARTVMSCGTVIVRAAWNKRVESIYTCSKVKICLG